jgi:hypothetical protein
VKLKKENLKKWKNKKEKFFIPIFLLRPLLETTRFDLKKLCQIWNLPVYPDVTNQNLTSTRNRIRLQLLPILRFFFNPQIDTILTQFAQINLQEQDYLNYLTTRLIKDLFSKKKFLQNKPTNFLKNISYKKKLYFYEVKTKENKLVFAKQNHFYQGFGKAYFALHFIEKMSAEQRKSNLYQIKAIISKKKNSSFSCVLRTMAVSHGVSILPSKMQHNCAERHGISMVAAPHIQHIGAEGTIARNANRSKALRAVVRSTNINCAQHHVLHKFEFQNQPLFFFPLAIQKRIGKKLIEYFLNKRVNFSHVEQIMKYLKNSQNVV